MRSFYAFLAIAIVTPMAGAYATCHVSSARVSGSSAKVGNIVLDLGEADDPRHPTSWQGPITITAAAGSSCTISEDVAVIEKPLLLAGTTVYIPTYSGSENRLYGVDTKTCRVIWESSPYTGPASSNHGELSVGGEAIRLDSSCKPETPSQRPVPQGEGK